MRQLSLSDNKVEERGYKKNSPQIYTVFNNSVRYNNIILLKIFIKRLENRYMFQT